ncbi:MAG: PHP domain-containing protein [Spirochaetales bacterium]|nr:PHP domain-containing protein [Spirochaetales bacterium]
MKADLHLHSDWSDGTDRPAEVLRAAAAAGLEAVSLTDHDTMAGVTEFLVEARRANIMAWPGVEIDCTETELGYRSELLAYFPNTEPPATATLLSALRSRRLERTKGHIDEARRLFGRSDLHFGDMLARRLTAHGERDPEGISWSRLDVYRYLLRKSAIPAKTTYREFRKAFFDSGLLRDGKYRKPGLDEVMKPVLADGGYAVIPHPAHTIGDDPERLDREHPRLIALLERFREAGVSGIELYAYAGESRKRLNDVFASLALAMGFTLTYGSDCHGSASDRLRIGTFHGPFDGFPWSRADDVPHKRTP